VGTKSFHRRFPSNGVFVITNKINGHTSHVRRREFLQLRSKLTTLWTESKFSSSVGQYVRHGNAQYDSPHKNEKLHIAYT